MNRESCTELLLHIARDFKALAPDQQVVARMTPNSTQVPESWQEYRARG